MKFIKNFESFIVESLEAGDKIEFTDIVDGLDVKRIGKVLEIAGKYAIVEYILDGKKAKTDVEISRSTKLNEEEEKEENLKNYMFFQNLKTIKKAVDKILSMDAEEIDKTLLDGHGWAVDHISTSKDDVEEVAGFLENKDEEDQMSPELKLAISEYHQSLRKQQNLQRKFLKIPNENFNAKESTRNELLSCMRDVRAKEDHFKYMLKEAGEQDLYEN
jgi:hypothetical protein